MNKKNKQNIKNSSKEIKNLIFKLSSTFHIIEILQNRIFNFFDYDCFNFLKVQFREIKQEQMQAMQLFKNSLKKLNRIAENN